MNKTESFVWLALAALLSLAGIAGFIVLFARDMTVYWFILSPLILIVYQFPAFVVFRMWTRKRAQSQAPEIEEARNQGDDGGPDAASDQPPGDDDRGES
jgi:phosphotransferase system  glucose/maltose/N-acetylglucosamine-specific IIC component